ncbi:hypothetical protein [Xanthomonas theicola]|uniref:Uncharacterized protein n=1 Tax=Xanthomonas theicola TaxID=56464 RepID=A0A2S6ZGM6_9XANT|nr:hypothetical protein [Xanthomonas theicola]PPT91403.1 hypothetical protein XthCFBP4691_07695 [Xanthomonas theicola]QNH27208.1 hypothetical protein G4Q83_22325 [Xanthomonas theicola]
MTSLTDVMKALREVIVMNERVTTLAGLVDKLAAESIETRERLVRVETILELAFKSPSANRGALLPGPD